MRIFGGSGLLSWNTHIPFYSRGAQGDLVATGAPIVSSAAIRNSYPPATGPLPPPLFSSAPDFTKRFSATADLPDRHIKRARRGSTCDSKEAGYELVKRFFYKIINNLNFSKIQKVSNFSRRYSVTHPILLAMI